MKGILVFHSEKWNYYLWMNICEGYSIEKQVHWKAEV